MPWLGLLILVSAFLFLLPIATVVWGSFQDTPPGVIGAYTVSNYAEIFASPVFWGAASNTLVLGLGASSLAFALGTFLAWITERTNAPGRRVIYGLVLLPIALPGVLMTIAWVLLLNPTIGILNYVAQGLLPLDGPLFNSYSMPAMIWVLGSDSVTLPFLFMAAAFRSMDPSLEEASAASGARLSRTLRRITLPMLVPTIFAAWLIVFMRAIEDFQVPAIMGIPAEIPVFATQIWLATRRIPTDFNVAAAFGILYLVVAAFALFLYFRMTRRADRYRTITGRGFRPSRIPFGRSRYLISAAAFVVLSIAVLLPFLVVLYTSLLPFYSPPRPEVLARITLQNYESLFASSTILSALGNSLVVGVGAAVVATFLGGLLSWVVLRTQLRARKLLDAIAFAPMAVPGIVVGLALIWVYLTLPVPIYGTLWIIALAFVTKYTSYAVRATHASLGQLHQELEEASQVSGATWLRTSGRIVVPLIAGGLLVSFVYILSLTFKVLSLPVLLAGGGTRTLPVLIFDLYFDGRYPELSALGVMMFVLLVVLSWLAWRLSSRSTLIAYEP